MIVDSSAVLAILRQEPEAEAFSHAIAGAQVCLISAGSLLETSFVVDTDGDAVLGRRLDDLIAESGILVVPVTADHVALGRAAYRDFGRGSGHPARLNFGDCFAYALARVTGEPLLFKGNDFNQTDLKSAL